MLDILGGSKLSHLILQGQTQPPPRLSERDLIALMDSHGIGTDATVAEHIQKQLERGYATKDINLTFWPTPLGEGLVGGYRRMGLQNLWLPDLRSGILQSSAPSLVTGHTISVAIQCFMSPASGLTLLAKLPLRQKSVRLASMEY